MGKAVYKDRKATKKRKEGKERTTRKLRRREMGEGGYTKVAGWKRKTEWGGGIRRRREGRTNLSRVQPLEGTEQKTPKGTSSARATI